MHTKLSEVRAIASFEEILAIFDDIFPDGTFVATNFLKKLVVVTDPNHFCNTLAVDDKGVLYINKPFWEKNILSDDDLKTVFLHELLHHIANDTYEISKIDSSQPLAQADVECMNVAMDTRINAFISRYLEFDSFSFFRRIYGDSEILFEQLLTPGNSNIFCAEGKKDDDPLGERSEIPEEIKGIYRYLYKGTWNGIQSYRDIYNILKRHRDSKQEGVPLLLGNHTIAGTKKDSVEGVKLPIEVEEAVRNLVRSKAAGTGTSLSDHILDGINGTSGKINPSIYKRLGFNHLFRNIRSEIKSYRAKKTKSPIPGTLYKNDMMKIYFGHIPFMWESLKKVPEREKICAPIYLDVSGSMLDYLPFIVSIITNIDSDIDYIWGFSDSVVKHKVEDLREGKIDTSYGTCFSCAIAHAVENKFKNLVIITDGFGGASKDKIAALRNQIREVVVLLTDNGTEDNIFSQEFNNTLKIKEAII